MSEHEKELHDAIWAMEKAINKQKFAINGLYFIVSNLVNMSELNLCDYRELKAEKADLKKSIHEMREEVTTMRDATKNLRALLS